MMNAIVLQTFVASLRNEDGGRTTLSDATLRRFDAEGSVQERELGTVAEFREALEVHFGIVPWHLPHACLSQNQRYCPSVTLLSLSRISIE